ncbi:a8852464-1541-4619-8e94-c6269f546201 [Thermothielavioides terrestris]|uniref:A8852464-1541-4619-8e94-c6269f546201 n=1 Tax=Thermothielavioides terrestris TaxID=2587410 RepID=A0A3S4AUE6_9PEZI|nr:a8852464-1541-4619-8e94-c6269f546201 [Thermothielavioides terrestris]
MSDHTAAEPSAASRLLQQHRSHHVTVEDASDEDLPAKPAAGTEATASEAHASSSNSTPAGGAAKQKANLATDSHEVFPELGGAASKPAANVPPVWAARTNANGKTNGASPANGTPMASAPPSGATTPTGPALRGAPSLSIPGRNVEYMILEAQHVLPRAQLKRPLADIVKDFNRKSRAQIKVITQPDNKVRVEATGPSEIATQALKDFVALIGTKLTIKVPIPRSARAHIIGKGGATIKALQEKTGARIQMPKAEDSPLPTIDVTIEGNSQQAAAAQNAVLKIVGERTANVSTSLKGIPAEFYPFIAGPNNSFINAIEQDKGIQIRVPPYQAWSSQPPVAPAPGQRPDFAPAADSFIHLAGEREAVKAAREEIERRAQELREQLFLEQFSIQRGRHQFIIGERGIPIHQFFEETGCTIVLPNDEDDDLVSIIGPAHQVQTGLERAMDLAMNMQCSNIDISRFHRQAPGGAAAHARNVTRYLRQRKELERLEKEYNVHVNTPFSEEGALPWELYSRDGKNAIRAQAAIKGLVDSHPPARMATVAVDPFFHHYIRNEVTPHVRQAYGVHLVVPEASEPTAPVLLVYEGPSSADSYQIPRSQPAQQEINEMQRWLREAQSHLVNLMNQQEAVTSQAIEVPQKYHDKLRKFIKSEQDKAANPVRARVSNVGNTVTIRGPSSVVDWLSTRCLEFIEQEKQDEKERGFILEFNFPQKFANHLIGKGGSHIRDLREKFDVDIQVNDGKVQLKGPKAKAEAAKSHITALARQLEDEATHVLKVDPKFHRELIGAQGSQINRLQTRYKVLIFFPRSPKNAKDDESVAESASDSGKARRQQAPDEVIIRGPKRGADEARDELLSLLQYLKDNSFTATVTVQQRQLPSLIGSGGAALEQLRQTTGAKIDVPGAKESADSEVEISIKGTKTQVAAAKKILEEKKAIFEDTVVKTIEVDRKYHKALIGAGGSALRDLVLKAGGSDDRRELARTIQFPKQDADGNTIKVEGRTAVVDKIIAQIKAFVEEREGQVTEVLDVPVDKHRTLIGRGGEAKRNLEAQFKVSIDVPRQGSGQTAVKIVGQSADVEKAKAHIQSLVKEQEGETVQVPRALHHAIANNGQIFRRFRNDFHVTVDHAGHAVPPKPSAPANTRANGGALPLITDEADAVADAHSWKLVEQQTSAEEGNIPWVLRGAPENVEKAKKAIEAALEQASKNNTTGYLILPDPRTYRFVIGQGGSKVNAIRKQSGCRINVPRDQSQGEAIEIVGSRDGVEKAKELILAAVKEGVSASGASGRQPRE